MNQQNEIKKQNYIRKEPKNGMKVKRTQIRFILSFTLHLKNIKSVF